MASLLSRFSISSKKLDLRSCSQGTLTTLPSSHDMPQSRAASRYLPGLDHFLDTTQTSASLGISVTLKMRTIYATCQEWLAPMIQQLVDGIKSLAAVASPFPHTAYAGMVLSLQAEWQYKAIGCNFLPAIFGGSTPMTIDKNFCCLLSHSIKMGGIGICDPT
ncbi:hypothetical protein ACHAXS_000719 [Conticribra weissflogii]